MGKWRTNPGYLTDDEAARERERTAAFVRSIASIRQINYDISSRKETRRKWYTGRLCDSCGTALEMSSWRCKKCDIAFCFKCAKEIKQFRRTEFLRCPMCDERLE